MARATRWVLAAVMSFALPGWGGAAEFLDLLPAPAGAAAALDAAATWGFDWGEDVPDAAQLVNMARRFAALAPERVRVVEYARSLEGRPLVLVLVSGAENVARLDALKGDLGRLAEPQLLSSGEAERLMGTLPAVVWIAGTVHGDEASGADAGLALAAYLASADTPEAERIRAKSLVIVDPVQNPDGRDRFVAALRQSRGRAPDAEPASAEHQQPWPGGRFSHDLFDLNRDWFVLSHPETRGRVAAMLEWHPTVVVDLHEMDAEEAYYFPPPAPPLHPYLSSSHPPLWDVLGRSVAAAFDRVGWRYWTREVFDSFYPGYGETWPSLNGAVGMTFEQASPRGQVTRLEDGSRLTHRDAVRHHLLAAFTTCLTVADQPSRFLRAWHDYRQEAVRSGGRRAVALSCADDPGRAAELAALLVQQGVEVWRRSGEGGSEEYLVPLGQPAGFLARTLLDRRTPMGEAFESEQVRRDARRLPDQIYDITAWSLPLLWGVALREIDPWIPTQAFTKVSSGELRHGTVSGEGRVAFVVPWTGIGSARVLAALLADGVRVGVAGKPFRIAGRAFQRGALVIRSADQPEGLRARLEALASRCGVDVLGADSGYAEEGIDLGSTSVRWVRPPRVAILWDSPTSPTSAGQLRHALETTIGYPVTVVRTATLAGARLENFDVIVMPDSRGNNGYARVLGEGGAAALANWVRQGGVLVGVGGAARYLAEEKVDLLASNALMRTKKSGGGAEEGERKPSGEAPFDLNAHVVPEEEEPPAVPGAILRVVLDREHLLAAGFPAGEVDVLVDSRRVFLPLTLDKGRNVGVYAQEGVILQSGFLLEASRKLLAQKAFFIVQGHGRGRVIAFAEDPSARAVSRASLLLFANAVFFGPTLEGAL